LDGIAKVMQRAVKLRAATTPIGIGSGISFTKDTPIVKNLETKIMQFVAVAFLLNGKILSS
jgi:hypothetical protein